MKFFTFDWWCGIQEPRWPEDPSVRYRTHLAVIRDRLLPDLLALEENISLHDGELVHLQLDALLGSLVMRVQGDDGNGGARTFLLSYGGVASFESRTNGRDGLPGPAGYGDLGYIEVDLCDGRFEHRVLFSSGIEFRMVFETLRYKLRIFLDDWRVEPRSYSSPSPNSPSSFSSASRAPARAQSRADSSSQRRNSLLTPAAAVCLRIDYDLEFRAAGDRAVLRDGRSQKSLL